MLFMQEFIVTNIASPMRLDRYLRIIDENLTQGVIEKALRSGFIKLAGTKVKSDKRVVSGDVITISDHIVINEKLNSSKLHFSANIISLSEKILGQYLLHENDDFIAINKPHGLATQGGSNISLSVDHALQYLNSKGGELRIVHRLDRDTSGLLLIAKNRLAATILGNAFHDRLITKKYIAVVKGNLKDKSGCITSYLTKAQEKMREVKEGEGKIAITEYKVLKNENDLYLVEFTPLTGRTHQIRCHAAFNLKAPIVGDAKYGTPNQRTQLLLHSHEIQIPKEVFGTAYSVIAPIPEYFII